MTGDKQSVRNQQKGEAIIRSRVLPRPRFQPPARDEPRQPREPPEPAGLLAALKEKRQALEQDIEGAVHGRVARRLAGEGLRVNLTMDDMLKECSYYLQVISYFTRQPESVHNSEQEEGELSDSA